MPKCPVNVIRVYESLIQCILHVYYSVNFFIRLMMVGKSLQRLKSTLLMAGRYKCEKVLLRQGVVEMV